MRICDILVLKVVVFNFISSFSQMFNLGMAIGDVGMKPFIQLRSVTAGVPAFLNVAEDSY